ncbi:hypothetical protein [Pseudonocardia kunmingensis]|uniref:Uncharacterized protein n=1 Tax=Pseudonocardia kunmingensis TaxID=630975 RepID=A0A543E1R8_9PSEU|nr:hypothetical protein [Pseudonocardia kunmingensis]TQM15524.1 hypothetical protein FB558_2313 [Pseudonocardia kunmingensis]
MFGQVWVLCALSFVAGSVVTWLLFARPPRRPPPTPPPPVTPMAPWAPDPAPEQPAPPPPVPPAPAPRSAGEPALANLDTHRDDVRRRHAGSAAAGALDRWGIGDPPRAPEIPRQAGPADAPPPDTPR